MKKSTTTRFISTPTGTDLLIEDDDSITRYEDIELADMEITFPPGSSVVVVESSKVCLTRLDRLDLTK